jgi:hypothetical protein
MVDGSAPEREDDPVRETDDPRASMPGRTAVTRTSNIPLAGAPGDQSTVGSQNVRDATDPTTATDKHART